VYVRVCEATKYKAFQASTWSIGLITHQSITHGLPCTLKHAVHSMDYFIHCTDEAKHRDWSSCLMLHHRYRYYIGPYSAYGCTDKYRCLSGSLAQNWPPVPAMELQ